MKISRRTVVICAGILLFGEVVWVLWPRHLEPEAPAARRTMERIQVAQRRAESRRSAGPPASAPEVYEFDDGGQPVRLDLSRVRSSLSKMVQIIPPSPPTAKAPPGPDAGFLSWPMRKIQGKERIKTQECRVVDFTNPAPQAEGGPVYLTRLFVRVKDGGFMRMQCYNWDGRLVSAFQMDRWKRADDGSWIDFEGTALSYAPGTKKVVSEQSYSASP